MAPRPWKRLGSKHLSDHHVLKVRVDRVVNPRDDVEHPRVVLEAPDWVTIIPHTQDGHVVMVRQFRFGIWENTLEVPGGLVDPGEAPPIAAARELEEETGFRAAKLISLGMVHPNPALQDNRCHIFLAEGCVKAHAGRLDATEDIDVELVAVREVPRLIQLGGISHSVVLAGFLLERLWREQAHPPHGAP